MPGIKVVLFKCFRVEFEKQTNKQTKKQTKRKKLP